MRTTRCPGAVGALQARSTSLSGTGAASTVSAPAAISAARAGSSATIAAVLDRALAAAHDAQVRGAQRRRRERDVRAGDRADLDPVERAAAVAAAGDDRAHGALGRRAPEVVEDDVDVGGRARARRRPSETVTSAPSSASAAEALGVAAGADHVAGAEALGDLDRHPAGVAGGAEHQHAAARAGWRSARRSAIQDDMAGFIAAAIAAGSLPAGSATLRRRSTTVCSAIDPRGVSGRTKYRSSPSARAADAVDAGDQRELAGARVVRAVRARAHARVQAGGEHVDDDLVARRAPAAPRRSRSGAGGRRSGRRRRAWGASQSSS